MCSLFTVWFQFLWWVHQPSGILVGIWKCTRCYLSALRHTFNFLCLFFFFLCLAILQPQSSNTTCLIKASRSPRRANAHAASHKENAAHIFTQEKKKKTFRLRLQPLSMQMFLVERWRGISSLESVKFSRVLKKKKREKKGKGKQASFISAACLTLLILLIKILIIWFAEASRAPGKDCATWLWTQQFGATLQWVVQRSSFGKTSLTCEASTHRMGSLFFFGH